MYVLLFPEDPQLSPQGPCYPLVAPFAKDEDVENPINLTARDVKLVKDASSKAVYRAKLHSKLYRDGPRRVICKCASGPQIKHLLHEATVYQSKLTGLQGVYVPRYIGIFYGDHPDGYDMAIMVLEDGGHAIQSMLRYTPLYFRQRVVGALLKIHHAGVVHNIFQDRNIIAKKLADFNPERPWYPMIVDFGDARMDHDCPYKDNKVETYIRAPAREDFKCTELYRACSDTAELWHSNLMEVYGVACPVEWADDGPEAFAKMAGSLLKHIPEDKRVAAAKALIQEYENEINERLNRDKQPLPIVDEEEYEKEYSVEDVEDVVNEEDGQDKGKRKDD